MQLCVVSPYPPEISGIGQYGWSVVRGLQRTRRFRSITVLTGGRAPARAAGALPGTTPARQVWRRDDPRSALLLLRAIQAERPQVVWFNLGFTVFGSSRSANFVGLAVPMLIRRMGIPVVITLHEMFEAAPPHALGAMNGRVTAWGAQAATQMLLRADLVCVTLRRYVADLQARYRARNVRHVPHGAFATPEFLPHPPDAPAGEILIFATHAPYKGLPVLLEAVARLQREGCAASLTVAGSDHPRFPGYLAGLRASANGARGITWLGAQTETQLRQVFARARVVALPYTATTGASSVLHRAAAFGRPVVASDLPDMRAVAEEEGLRLDFVPPSDPAALAQALDRLLNDPARQAAMAQHNLGVMRGMTLEHTCALYADLFEQASQRSA